MPFGDSAQPDFLSVINAEVEKVHLNEEVPSPTDFATSITMILPKEEHLAFNGSHLKAETFDTLEIPIDGLSDAVQLYIHTVADAFGCPKDYVTAICLSTAGIAAGKKVHLETSPYSNYPSDFTCIVGKPSRNKTGPMQEITRPLRERDKSVFESYLKEKAAYDQNKREDRSFNGEKPVFHQRVAGDSSPEARNALLAQGDMILIIADELKSFIDSFGRYSKGGNGTGTEVSQLLSTWSNVSFTINRKSEETKLVDDPAMSIIGGIQPSPLGKTFGTDALMDTGFTQRFLFVYPDKTKFVKRCDRKQMTVETRNIWSETICRLFDIEPRALRLSNKAERIYSNYADANDMKADAEEDDYIGGVKQKMNIHVLRLSIMAHLLSDHWNETIISGETMNYAIRIADYFTRVHVERIYPLLTANAVPGQKKLTKELIITEIGQLFDIHNKSALAEALGYDRAKLTNILNGKLKK